MCVMNAVVPDLFDKDPDFAPAAQPLRSRKREAFCQNLAGECHDNQTEAYCRAFGVEDRKGAGASAARLMRNPEVRARVAHLREEAVRMLGVDRLYLLQKRKWIAEHARNMADRLNALAAMEKSLGLDEPVKIDINSTSNVNVAGIGGVFTIENAGEFARMMEAVRAAQKTCKPAEEAVTDLEP